MMTIFKMFAKKCISCAQTMKLLRQETFPNREAGDYAKGQIDPIHDFLNTKHRPQEDDS